MSRWLNDLPKNPDRFNYLVSQLGKVNPAVLTQLVNTDNSIEYDRTVSNYLLDTRPDKQIAQVVDEVLSCDNKVIFNSMWEGHKEVFASKPSWVKWTTGAKVENGRIVVGHFSELCIGFLHPMIDKIVSLRLFFGDDLVWEVGKDGIVTDMHTYQNSEVPMVLIGDKPINLKNYFQNIYLEIVFEEGIDQEESLAKTQLVGAVIFNDDSVRMYTLTSAHEVPIGDRLISYGYGVAKDLSKFEPIASLPEEEREELFKQAKEEFERRTGKLSES